jgi:hypothetical protein
MLTHGGSVGGDVLGRAGVGAGEWLLRGEGSRGFLAALFCFLGAPGAEGMRVYMIASVRMLTHGGSVGGDVLGRAGVGAGEWLLRGEGGRGFLAALFCFLGAPGAEGMRVYMIASVRMLTHGGSVGVILVGAREKGTSTWMSTLHAWRRAPLGYLGLVCYSSMT